MGWRICENGPNPWRFLCEIPLPSVMSSGVTVNGSNSKGSEENSPQALSGWLKDVDIALRRVGL